jgi:hypothetical protein
VLSLYHADGGCHAREEVRVGRPQRILGIVGAEGRDERGVAGSSGRLNGRQQQPRGRRRSCGRRGNTPRKVRCCVQRDKNLIKEPSRTEEGGACSVWAPSDMKPEITVLSDFPTLGDFNVHDAGSKDLAEVYAKALSDVNWLDASGADMLWLCYVFGHVAFSATSLARPRHVTRLRCHGRVGVSGFLRCQCCEPV